MLRRFVQFCVPSLLGACAAGLLATLAETALHTRRPIETFAGAGFLLLFALPIGTLASMVGRSLVRAWNFSELLAPIVDERGASPRFCAWLLFLLAAGGVLWGGTFQGMRMLFAATRVNALVALGAPVVVVAIGLGLVAISKPTVVIFEQFLTSLEARRAAKGKRALAKPLYLALTVVTIGIVTLCVSWWVVILPSIGHLDIGFVSYILLFVVGVIVFPLLWQHLASGSVGQRSVGVVLMGATLVCIVSSQWARYQRPYTMLEIWGETKLAGWAIDSIYDVQALRVDLRIDGIEPIPVPGAPHPNVVVITIDTMRADRVPVYGGQAKMPRLKDLSRTAAVFERAYSPGNVTRRSLPTLATGLSPSRVRGRVVGWALRLDPRHVMLAERFQAGGYETAGFFCCRSHFGRDHKLGLIRGIDHVDVEYDAMNLATINAEWLRARPKTDAPLFMWTHYIEPHNWVKDHKPGPEGRTKDARYNLSLAATDDALDVLLESVYETLGENTIVVVTSDHGEGLGDHGIPHHAGSLYNSEIRVPLIIAGPGINPSRKQQAVGLVDLAPTLLELAGFEAPGMPQMDGLSLAPELLGTRDDALGLGEAYSQMVSDRSVHQSQAAVISGRFKLISREGGKYELFDTSRDPRETKDIKDKAPKLFKSMKARLARRRKVDRVPPF
jgi:arylsulfatase A-like enzyme